MSFSTEREHIQRTDDQWLYWRGFFAHILGPHIRKGVNKSRVPPYNPVSKGFRPAANIYDSRQVIMDHITANFGGTHEPVSKKDENVRNWTPGDNTFDLLDFLEEIYPHLSTQATLIGAEIEFLHFMHDVNEESGNKKSLTLSLDESESERLYEKFMLEKNRRYVGSLPLPPLPELAGSLEASGRISIYGANDEYNLVTVLYSKFPGLIEALKAKYGGYIVRPEGDGRWGSPSYGWRGTDVSAQMLLADIEPYAMLLRPQVELALNFSRVERDLNRSNASARGRLARLLVQFDSPNFDLVTIMREGYRLTMKSLNRPFMVIDKN